MAINNFNIHWALINKIAIGPLPQKVADFQLLKEYNAKLF